MTPFTSIESYRHIVASVKKYCADKGKPLPTIEYKGTVKLHGTNAGVRVTPHKVQPQKRTSIVDIGSDNAGFAAFCHGKDHMFRRIAREFSQSNSEDITIYGEWCGGNIQSNVAISQLEKHFVIFSVYDAEKESYVQWNSDCVKDVFNDLSGCNDAGIYFIDQIPSYSISIDFSKPEDALAKLEEYTLAVEEECPWGKFRGTTGIGEGIVWSPIDTEYSAITGLWFKTKGMKHAAKGAKKATNIQASPEKLESIRAVVEAVLPAWRLEQGITFLKENGKEIIPQNTGEYIKWVSQDILKEDVDIIVANGFDWKSIVPYLMPQIRQHYMNKINEEAFA